MGMKVVFDEEGLVAIASIGVERGYNLAIQHMKLNAKAEGGRKAKLDAESLMAESMSVCREWVEHQRGKKRELEQRLSASRSGLVLP